MAATAAKGQSHGGTLTPPTTPPEHDKVRVLTNVLSLATLFSSCVEVFNLIHPSKDSDHRQKLALTKLGIQQGRLLIFGDAVGISSPPPSIATHMIPSRPGATNPDPSLPVNFGLRDPKLDDATINAKVRAALDEIAGRPSHLSRDDLMEKYGLKSPKRFTPLEYPALDSNRLEAFREKYALLQDLVHQMGIRAGVRRGISMTASHWTVRDADKFDAFVKTVREEVDGLIALMGVGAQVDRSMKLDIRAMGWHPDLSGPVVRHDWEKLKLIREACVVDYPQYVDVTDTALKYISEELRGTSLAGLRSAYAAELAERKKLEQDATAKSNGTKVTAKEKRPGFLSHFKFKSWNKSQKGRQERSKSISAGPSGDEDPQRSLSEDFAREDMNDLEPVRSKSLSALPDDPAPFNLDTRLETVPTIDEASDSAVAKPIDIDNQLTHADTANSLIDRHDMYKGMGRVETKDIRRKAHEWT